MTSTEGLHAPRREPEWARIPPHVSKCANPPSYFRQTPAEKYTAPDGLRNSDYQKWWNKWYQEQPSTKCDENYRFNSQFPKMAKADFSNGLSRPAYDIYDKPFYRNEYLRQGSTLSETTRARAIYREHWASKRPYTYQFSNAMTSTQYDRPSTSIYGPLYRQPVYGVQTLHNRHGFMPAFDYY